MKKRMVLALTLIAIVSMVAATAAAPMASKSVTLTGTRFVDGKGTVFTFQTTGLNKADLNSAFAYASGNPLDTYCKMRAEGIVVCTVKDINRYAGQQVLISLAGFGFWATVPTPHTTANVCWSYSYLTIKLDITP